MVDTGVAEEAGNTASGGELAGVEGTVIANDAAAAEAATAVTEPLPLAELGGTSGAGADAVAAKSTSGATVAP